jgi:hypothetical protein
MSSRAYHYRKAEELLREAGPSLNSLAAVYARAQVHATLATASAGVEEHARAIEGLAAEHAEYAEYAEQEGS